MNVVWILLRDIGFVLAALIYGIAFAAGFLYYARFRKAMKQGMAGRRKESHGRAADFDWVGALPAHVWLGSVAICLLLVPLMGQLVSKYTAPPYWWGLPFIVAGEAALLASLTEVVRYELRGFR